MTQIFTAHGIGDLIKSETVRGRTSYLVKGAGFQIWMDATKARIAAEGGGEQLFGYDFTPEKHLDPDALLYSASDAFVSDPAVHVNESNSTVLPYDPTPQYPVDMFVEQTIQPGEQEIDADQRLSPSDSRTQRDRSPSHTYPGPVPKLFAGAQHYAEDDYQGSPEGRPQSLPTLESSPPGPDDREYPHQLRDPEMPRLHPDDDPVYPFDTVSQTGQTTHELDPEGSFAGDDDGGHWYHCDDCGAWHSPFRHYQDYRHVTVSPRDKESSTAFLSNTDLGLSDKYADILGERETDPFLANPAAFLDRHAAVLEGETGLDPRVGQYMDLVLADKNIRTAAWRDVRTKALRLRHEGRISIKQSTPEAFRATVQGDHGFYDTIIIRGNVFDLGGQSVTAWHCACPWGQWAFKRKLTYVGRMCSHAYASYLQMQSNHNRPSGGSAFRNPYNRKFERTPWKHSSVVDDFKQWAKDNDQPTDETSLADFISKPVDKDEDPPGDDEVDQLYDYVRGSQKESPQREFDVPYTFDHDKVYKSSGRQAANSWDDFLDKDMSEHPENYLVGKDKERYLQKKQLADWDDFLDKDMSEHPENYIDDGKVKRQADALRLTPHSLTPDLQFVPEGEAEHFVDVEKDDRKTTGPGQIMHEGIRAWDPSGSEAHEDWNREHPPVPSGGHVPAHSGEEMLARDQPEYFRDEDEPETIEHFSAAWEGEGHPPWLNQDEVTHPHHNEQGPTGREMWVPEGFEYAQGEHGGEHRPFHEDSGQYGPEYMAARYADIVEHEMRPDAGEAAGDLDRLRDLIAEPHDEHFGEMDDYTDDMRNLVDDLHDAGTDASPISASRRTADGGFMDKGDGGWADLPFQGSGPDPKWWSSTSEDYVNDNERPRFQDVTDLPDGDIIKYNDSDGPVTKPKEPSKAKQAGIFPPWWHQGDLVSDQTSAVTPMGGNVSPVDPGSMSGGQPDIEPGDAIDTGITAASSDFGAPGDFVSPGAAGSPTGAGAGDYATPTGPSGAGAGDMVAPSASGDKMQFAQRRHRPVRENRPSIRDQIRHRQGYDTTTLPGGWGDVPSEDDGESPFPKIPGQDQAKEMMDQVQKVAPEVAPELMAVAAQYDNSDIVREFHGSQGAQGFGRGSGGGGGEQMSSRTSAMTQFGAARGSRGHFSNDDISGAADAFLRRTAGRHYSPQEQAELMDEFHPLGARNLDGLNLAGTHYES